jgi:hypothetical protein
MPGRESIENDVAARERVDVKHSRPTSIAHDVRDSRFDAVAEDAIAILTERLAAV